MASLTPTTTPPAFRITYTAADLSASVSTVALYRTADGVTNLVRTANGVGAIGGFTAFDAEAPQGVPVAYRVLQFDTLGNQIGYAATTLTGTIASIDPMYGWISDPLVEGSAIKVVMTDTAGTQPKRTVPGSVYTIGATAVVLAGQRGPLAGTDMGFYTLSTDDDAKVLSLIDSANGMLLIRTQPGFGVTIPRALYCFAAQTNPTYLDGNGSLWTNEISEVSPTAQPVEQSAASWQDVINTFTTWTAAEAAFGSWLDLEQAFDN
jgi:hypothetical protein